MESIISVINLKGGVGKSTTSINMAAILATEYSKRVLLIDNDKQGNTSRFFDKFMSKAPCGSSRMILRDNPVQFKIWENLYLINANMSLESAEYEVMKDTRSKNYDRYKEGLEKIANEYDYVIIDNPPAVSMCVINALYASTEVIIPVKLDNWSLDGIDVVSAQIEQIKKIAPQLQIKGILISDYLKTPENAAAEKWLRQNCKYNVFEQKIRYSKKVDASTYYKQPLIIYSKTSAAAVDYKKMTKEYMQGKQ